MDDYKKTKAELIVELQALRSRVQHPAPTKPHGTDPAFCQIINDLPQMYYEIDLNGKFTFANQQALLSFGFTAADLIKGLYFHDVVHPDDLQRATENIASRMKGQGTYGEAYDAKRKDGTIFPVTIYSNPIIINGDVIGARGTIVDMTNTRETEKALRKSESYYRTLFNNTGTALVTFGSDCVIHSFNHRFATLSGYSEDEIRNKMKWTDFVAPYVLNKMKTFHEKRDQKNTAAPQDYEFDFHAKNKIRKRVHVFVKIIPETQDRVCSLIDITEREKVEQALRTSEERYKLVVQGANDGIWDWNLDTDAVWFSPRYKEILGYTDEEFPNTIPLWKAHVHPDDMEHVLAANTECMQGKVDHFEVEYRMRHKDGSYRWILGRGASAKDENGNICRLAGTHTDITIRKTQERATNVRYAISKASSLSQDLNQLFKDIHIILNSFIRTHNFFISLINEEEDCLTFPYFEDEQDSYLDIRNISDPNESSLIIHVLRTGQPFFISQSQPDYREQLQKVGIVGTPPAVWLGVPLIVKNKIIGAMAIQDYNNPLHYKQADATLLEAASEQIALAIERKRAEEALNKFTMELESKVETRTLELQKKASELEVANNRFKELDSIKSTLVSSVSHELRTPLTSIRGFARLTIKDINRYFLPLANSPVLERKGERILQNLGVIESEGERLTRLINDFLDISRIESQNATWHDILLDTREVILEATQTLSGALSAKPEIELVVNLPETLPTIHADPDKIKQILLNLLNNAFKFTQKGSIAVSANTTAEYMTVFIEDTGSGIPVEDQEKIFERFHKSSRGDTVTLQDKGTGLGLAICKEIVEHYEGTIQVESTLGVGSTFSFTLPTATR